MREALTYQDLLEEGYEERPELNAYQPRDTWLIPTLSTMSVDGNPWWKYMLSVPCVVVSGRCAAIRAGSALYAVSITLRLEPCLDSSKKLHPGR